MYRHRYREARKVGLSRENAGLFAASPADVGVLRKLAKDGCAPHLIVGILL